MDPTTNHQEHGSPQTGDDAQLSDEQLHALYGDNVPTVERVQEILDQIRPMIQMDGGDMEYVDLKLADGELWVRLGGACVGCPASSMTLKAGVEQMVQEQFPNLEVIAVA